MYGVSLKRQGRPANRHFGGSGVRAINTGMSCPGSFVAPTVRLGKYYPLAGLEPLTRHRGAQRVWGLARDEPAARRRRRGNIDRLRRAH
jgi:hypothetical protein